MQLIENLNSVSSNTKKKLKYRTIQNIINLKTVNMNYVFSSSIQPELLTLYQICI